jgi:hypothetical protein
MYHSQILGGPNTNALLIAGFQDVSLRVRKNTSPVAG